MRKFRRRQRSENHTPEISLTPLIDTALTLLIIFMVTAPMMQNAIKVDLPKGQAKEDKNIGQELIVFVDTNEKLYLNDKEFAQTDALIQELKEKVGSNQNQTVYIKADKTVRYGYVIELVDTIKVVGGVSYVALATKKA